MKLLRAHNFAPPEAAPAEPEPKRRPPTPPAVARRIAEGVGRRRASDQLAIRLSGIRPKDPASPTARELHRARVTMARREKFAGLFFQKADTT